MSYIMVPLSQRQLNEFKDTIWNPHRIRHQRDTIMADGIPNHIYDFPEKYGMEECGNNNRIVYFFNMIYTIDVIRVNKRYTRH